MNTPGSSSLSPGDTATHGLLRSPTQSAPSGEGLGRIAVTGSHAFSSPIPMNQRAALATLAVAVPGGFAVASPYLPWNTASEVVTSSLTRIVSRWRLFFELKVLGEFLKEILLYRKTVSRITVDEEKRTIEIERD